MAKRKLTIALASIVLSSQLIVVQAAPSFIEDREEQIKKNNEKIETLQEEKSQINSSKKTVEQELNSLASKISQRYAEISSEEKAIAALEDKISNAQNRINTISGEISSTENKIEEVKANISAKEEEKKAKEELLGKRIRNIYKNNPYDRILVVLLESKGLSDFVSRVASISRVISKDNELIAEVEGLKNELVQDKEKLDGEILSLNAKKNEVIQEQNNLENDKSSVEKRKADIQSKVAELKDLEDKQGVKYAQLSSEEKKVSNEIAAIDNINDELQKEMDDFIASLNSNNGSNSNESNSNESGQATSGFLRPTNGRVTSEFGYRIHPVYGVKKLHKGIDLGSPRGTPVKASKSGTVAFSGVKSGYGNVVILNHGNGVQTLYAHNDTLKVSVGQQVSQGQVISTVGNTGVGTGYHLHFEIRINGTAVNPRNYLSF